MQFRSPPWESVVYWSLDLETGGLDTKKDPILAVGMVPIRETTIRLGEAFHSLVRLEGAAIDPASVPAHQIVRREVQDAPSLHEVLPEVDRRIREGALVVHHQGIDVAFLKREYARARISWPRPAVVDTLALARRLLRAAAPALPGDALPLQLGAARERWGLPDYTAHDALTDAIAAAELFLVLRRAMGAKTLRELR